MSKRKTKCLTWGQQPFELSTTHLTLCGRADPDCTTPDLWSPSEPRPKGVCPDCWKDYRNTMLADMYCCPPTTEEKTP